MNPAPIITVSGLVHSVTERVIPPFAGRDASRDEDGTFRPAMPPREGYLTWECNILTDDGGFALVVLREQAVADSGGTLSIPEKGSRFEAMPTRPYLTWVGTPGRMTKALRLSIAGDVYASRLKATEGSRRALSAS